MKAFFQEKRLHSERDKVPYFEVSAIQALPLIAKRKLPDGKRKSQSFLFMEDTNLNKGYSSSMIKRCLSSVQLSLNVSRTETRYDNS